MSTEQLRLEAEVVDKFSAPLQRLRSQLRAAPQVDGFKATRAEFDRLQQAVARTTTALQSGYGSVLAGLNLQSVAAVGGITAVTTAITRFASQANELRELGRQTGVSMRNLQALQGVASQFGSSSEVVANGVKAFAQNFYDVQRGVSGLTQDLLNADPSGKLLRHFSNPNRDRALSDVLVDLGEINKQGVKGAETAARISEKMFGTRDFATMTADIERFKRALADASARAKPFSEEDFKRAQAFAAAIGKLQNSLSALADTIGTELAPPLTKAIEAIDKMIKDSNGQMGQNLAEGVKVLGETLSKFNWDSISASFGSLSGHLADVGRMIRVFSLLNDGKAGEAWQVFKDMGARTAAPKSIADARSEVEARRQTLSDFDRTNPGDARRRWHEENLRSSEEKLRKAIEEGARLGIKDGLETMIQKQSFTGGSGGERIWNASFGGGYKAAADVGSRIRRGLGLPDSGAPAPPPEANGTYRPVYKLTDKDLGDSVVNTIAGEASWKRPGAVDAVINNMMNRIGSSGWGPSGSLHSVARAPGQYAGYKRAGAEEAAYIRDRIKAIAAGGAPDNTNGSNSFRAGWYSGPWMQRHGRNGVNIGGHVFAYQRGIPNGPYGSFKEPRKLGGSFDAARESGTFGSPTVSAPTGRALLDIQLHGFPSGTRTRADGGDLFNRVDVNPGRTVAADQ